LLALAKVKTLSTKEIQLYTDSTYVIQGISKWVHGWKRNGWRTAEGQDVINRELWEKLLKAEAPFQVKWLYVPGHKGYPGNERCDQIAVAFSRGEHPRLYTGSLTEYPVDLHKLPKPSPLPDSGRKKGPAVYLSLIDGALFRDKDWKSCEARVKGRRDARFKRVESPEEEAAVLEAWGVTP
jgi:ribonuclease HI